MNKPTLPMANLVSASLTFDSGQDLIEYSFLVGLMALGATAGMHSAAVAVSGVFTAISAVLVSATG